MYKIWFLRHPTPLETDELISDDENKQQYQQ